MGMVEVAFDMYPARVASGDRVWTKARAAVVREEDGDTLMVWTKTGGKIASVMTASVASHEGSPDRALVLGTDSGSVTVSKGGGCGCGSPLRSYNPWPGRRRKVVGFG